MLALPAPVIDLARSRNKSALSANRELLRRLYPGISRRTMILYSQRVAALPDVTNEGLKVSTENLHFLLLARSFISCYINQNIRLVLCEVSLHFGYLLIKDFSRFSPTFARQSKNITFACISREVPNHDMNKNFRCEYELKIKSNYNINKCNDLRNKLTQKNIESFFPKSSLNSKFIYSLYTYISKYMYARS